MPLVDHLMELRKRILISISAVFVCAVVVFIFYNPVLHFLSKPYEAGDRGRNLIVTDPLAPLIVRLKISGYGGLALAIPIVMWQIWRFVVPGLQQARAPLRGVVHPLGGPLVPARLRRGVVHGHQGARVPARHRRKLDHPADRRQQVPDAGDADVRGVRRRVRVPAAPGVPDARGRAEHPAAPRSPAAGRRSASPCSRP